MVRQSEMRRRAVLPVRWIVQRPVWREAQDYAPLADGMEDKRLRHHRLIAREQNCKT